ncbi:hypothetical protein RJ639_010759 [Escallonia herrerae]|uniref:BAG family molecular chaperone regulator 4 n=1 Tax=Escallonia herrerae TaxID=1293975 RepID=A0AA88VN41_9ASTE|nr:hypothetical protein RJ639_010759 [Escallonia herrerae]
MKRIFRILTSDRAEKNGRKSNEEAVIDWEVRPCGMLVQKRCVRPSAVAGATSGGPTIKIKVSHDGYYHDVALPAQSSFGDLKRVLAKETGLEPEVQRLLFGGKEKNDGECLHMVGVKDMSKVILMEDPASKERKVKEMKENEGKASEAVAEVRAEVDMLAKEVVALEMAVQNGIKVADKDFVVLTELLMVQLLKLDGVQAEGESKVQRRIEVCHVQSLVEALDHLKARDPDRFNDTSHEAVSVTSKWEIFDSGVGSLSVHNKQQSPTKVTRDWELFD